MKIKRILYLIVLTLFSCSKDDINEFENQVNTSLITIKSTENLNQEFKETWVIISNEMGHILAYGELTKDSTFVTNNKVEGSINVTFLDAYEDRYFLQTFTEIMLDDTWFIKDESKVISGQRKLTASLNIKNIFSTGKNTYLYSISNAHGTVFDGGGSSGNNTRFDISIDEQAPKDILFVFTDGLRFPIYAWFTENLFAEKNVNMDFLTDFTQMDHILFYSFNNIKNQYMDITAYDEEKLSSYRGLDGYLMAEFFNSDEESFYQLKVGYLEGFDYYRTRWSANISGKSYSYTKFGGPPEEFSEDLFDSDFEVINAVYNDFQFTATGDFDVVSGRWGSEDEKINWSIYYPMEKSINLVLSDLPTEIKARYPELTLANLTYEGSTFTDMIENEGYFSFIDYIHKNENGKNVTEQYSLSKSID